MSKPILYNVETFDATRQKVFKFSWNGSALNSCKLKIYNSNTDVLIVNGIQSITNKIYEYVLDANILTNDNSYYASLITYDNYDNESSESNIIQFNCVVSPDFDIDITNNTTITTSGITVNVEFDDEIDSIQELKFYLLDSNKKIIIESDEILVETFEDLTYRFLGLENNKSYYIYSTCLTTNGFNLETDYKKINVYITTSDFGGKCYVEANNQNGYIRFSTLLTVVQYNGTKEYSYSNGVIDLKDNYLFYDEGFKLYGDLKISIIGMNFQNKKIFTSGLGNGDEISIYFNQYDDLDNLYKARLIVNHGNLKYITFSNSILLESDKLYRIWITRENDIYGIEITEI